MVGFLVGFLGLMLFGLVFALAQDAFWATLEGITKGAKWIGARLAGKPRQERPPSRPRPARPGRPAGQPREKRLSQREQFQRALEARTEKEDE